MPGVWLQQSNAFICITIDASQVTTTANPHLRAMSATSAGREQRPVDIPAAVFFLHTEPETTKNVTSFTGSTMQKKNEGQTKVHKKCTTKE